MAPEEKGEIGCFDTETIILLYRNHWKGLFNLAYRILKDKQACEDIIQDVFINVWNKRQQIDVKQSLKGYLEASVRYEVFRKLRNEKKFEPVADEFAELYHETLIDERLDYKEALKNISSKIEELPVRCREVYLLSRTEHLSHSEISSRLAISTKTVRNHLTRALRQLRPGGIEFVIFVFITLCS